MISIIITYYKGLNILKTNLALLIEDLPDNVEIIIVNDNPSTHLEEGMFPLTPNISFHIIEMKQNAGYAAACNYGADHALGDLLVFMDSDILVTKEWLNYLLDTYNNNENCGAVSTTIFSLNQKTVVHWGMAIHKGMEVIKPFRDGILPRQIQHGTYEFNIASSGCILIPHDVFEKVGQFDEQLYNGFCDLDLTYRITNQGYKCLYCSDAIVYHRGKVSGTVRTAAEDDTRALFMRKWAADLPNDGMDLLEKLYNLNIPMNSPSEYFIINFSRSLFAKDYHTVLLNCLKASVKTYYELRQQSSTSIILEDHLPWGFCGLNLPIIYFVDTIVSIIENQHWFMHRVGKGDMIADKNGNLISTDSLLK